jgi:WD40 repeat protein
MADLPNPSVGEPGHSSDERTVRAFLCYRRSDGSWHADWINRILDGQEWRDGGGHGTRLAVYYDRTAPGVADWKKLHFPSLQSSQALILICTPGVAKDFSKRGHPDWVYEELRWWIRHRRIAPIVIDGTGEGERWLPSPITKRWPNINRIDVSREQAERETESDYPGRVRERIVGAIRQSERATYFEDLERARRQSRRLAAALVVATSLLLVAIAAVVAIYRLSSYANAQRRLALSRALAARAEFIRFERPAQLELSVLLATEALRAADLPEARQVLQGSLALFPHQVAQLVHGKDGLITRMLFSPDGKYLATAGRDWTARLWTIPDGRNVFVSKNADVVLGLAMSKDGRLLAMGSGDLYCSLGTGTLAEKDRTARVVSIPSGGEIMRVQQEHAILAVSISPGAKYLATAGCDNTARIWEIPSGRELARLEHAGQIFSVDFSPDGTLLATGGWDNYAKLWHVPDGRSVAVLKHHDGVESVAFSRDGAYLATGTVGNYAHLWRVKDHSEALRMVHAGRAHNVTFSHSGREVATVSYDGTVLVWEVPEGRVAARFSMQQVVISVAFSPDDVYLAIGAEDTGSVWEWRKSREVARILNEEGRVSKVAFSASGDLLATGGAEEDHSVRLWQMPYMKPPRDQDLERVACARLRRNMTMAEWRAAMGDEPYRRTCPGLPEPAVRPATKNRGEAGELEPAARSHRD